MKPFTLAIVLLLTSACSTSLKDYRETSPEFVLEDYFSGNLIAWGIVQDYSKKLTRHFCVEIASDWTEKNGKIEALIDEQFYFHDGEVSQRLWRLSKHHKDNGSYYIGTADDVEGEAKGSSSGQAFQWQYRLQVPLRGDDGSVSIITLDIDDWIYLIDEYRAFNRSTMKKYGVTVGEITLFFNKQAPLPGCTDNRPQVSAGSLLMPDVYGQTFNI